MRFDHRHPRWRRATALAIVLAVPVTAAGAGGEDTGAGIPSLPEARAMVASAEARLSEVTAERDTAKAALDTLDARSKDLAERLADARSELRGRAVTAFITGEPDETVLVILGGENVFDASARHHLMAHVADESRRSVERYDRLKSRVNPRLVATAERLQRLEQDVRDATDGVLAARANEAEAERQQEERDRQARLAREAAQAAADAARAAARRAAAATVPAPVAAAGTLTADAVPVAPPPTAPPVTAPLPDVPAGGPSEAQWAALRKCESGGNYRAVSASGKYRGAYQFDYQTWRGLGGSGDPAAAPPAEQDARAQLLYSQRGWRPWPVCGRYLR